MKKFRASIVLHIIVAVALSLVINFSYLLVPIITDQGMKQRGETPGDGEHSVGTLQLSSDMHGYIICDCEQRDSTYVSAWQVRTFKLQNGDTLKFTTKEAHSVPDTGVAGVHPRLDDVVMRNGEKFDLDVIYDRPSRTVEFIWQIVYYALIAFVLIYIFTLARRSDRKVSWVDLLYVLLALVVSAIAIYFSPVMAYKDGMMRIVFFFDSEPRDNMYYVVLTKMLFVFVVSALYAYVFTLLRQRQKIVVENERLKNENLSTRYNMLMGQINPTSSSTR